MSFCIKNTWCSHSERVTTPNIIEPTFKLLEDFLEEFFMAKIQLNCMIVQFPKKHTEFIIFD